MSPLAYCRKYKLSGAEFGRRVGISKFTACRLLKREQRVSPKRALKIAAATNGEITKHDLRPDIFGRNPKIAKSAAIKVANCATIRQASAAV